METLFEDIQEVFHTMPQVKYELPDGLEQKWLQIAVADYELEVGTDLGYDPYHHKFNSLLPNAVCRTLAQMMYVYHLQRELSRVMALNGIYGKDITITGTDATKRVTQQELNDQRDYVDRLLHKQKVNSYGE